MSTNNKLQRNIKDRRVITAFSFYEFLIAAQSMIQQGYVFDEANENFPTAFTGNYNAGMLLFEDVTEEVVVEAKVATEHPPVTATVPKTVEQPISKVTTQRGRKANSK